MEVCNNFVRETNSYQSAGITFCRVVFTIAIVLCHIAEPTNFIKVGNVLNIGVQVFFVISGFLYGRKVINGIKDFYIKRIKKIYLPYLIFVSLALIAYYLFHKDYLSYDKVLLYLFNLQAFTTIKGLGHTWFVTSIMLCYLITPLLQKISQYAHPVIWCILSFFIQFIDVQFLGMRSMYLFLYCAAYFLAKLDFKHFNIIGISAILIWVLLVLICGNDNLDWEGHRSIWGHFHYLGGVSLFYFFLTIFDLLKISKLPSVLYRFSALSYYVYLVHGIIILGPFSVWQLPLSTFLKLLITSILVLLMSISLKEICERIYRFDCR